MGSWRYRRIIFPKKPPWLYRERICQGRRWWRQEFNSWVGKIPWRRQWQPTLVFSPGTSREQRSLAGCSPRGTSPYNLRPAESASGGLCLDVRTLWNYVHRKCWVPSRALEAWVSRDCLQSLCSSSHSSAQQRRWLTLWLPKLGLQPDGFPGSQAISHFLLNISPGALHRNAKLKP